MKLRPLSHAQRIGWYWVSVFAGAWLIPVAFQVPEITEGLKNLDPAIVVIFAALWGGQVFALRLYVQQVDTQDFWSIVGLRKWMKKPE